MDAPVAAGVSSSVTIWARMETMKFVMRLGQILIGTAVVGAAQISAAQTPPPVPPQSAVRPVASTPIPDAIDSLARSFSGGNSAPVCRLHGEDMDGAPTTVCDWLASGNRSKTPGVDSVFTSRVPHDGGMLSYFRTMANVPDMTRFIDSLDVSLKARGLVPRNCRAGEVPAGHAEGHVWEDGKLVVLLLTITSASKPPKATIMSIDNPAIFPPVACRPPD